MLRVVVNLKGVHSSQCNIYVMQQHTSPSCGVGYLTLYSVGEGKATRERE